MNYTILFIIIACLMVIGCTALDKKKEIPPTVSTGQVIQSLNDTKTELKEAGEANTKVAVNIDKALSLAQRLDVLLQQIEKEQQTTANKNIIKPL
jgi:redox-regulated HSP33 family molecular chaperone